MPSTKTADRFSVIGLDVNKTYPTAGAALSAAITFADREREAAEYTVTDSDGETVGKVFHRADGTTSVHRFGKAVA